MATMFTVWLVGELTKCIVDFYNQPHLKHSSEMILLG